MCNRDKYFAHRAERLKKKSADLFVLAYQAEQEIGSRSMCASAEAARELAYYADDTASRAAWCETATETDIESACKRWMQEEGFWL